MQKTGKYISLKNGPSCIKIPYHLCSIPTYHQCRWNMHAGSINAERERERTDGPLRCDWLTVRPVNYSVSDLTAALLITHSVNRPRRGYKRRHARNFDRISGARPFVRSFAAERVHRKHRVRKVPRGCSLALVGNVRHSNEESAARLIHISFVALIVAARGR